MSDMMKDCEATIGRLIDKQTTAFISSVDPDGFPKHEGNAFSEKEDRYSNILFYDKHILHAVSTVSRKPEGMYLFL